MNDKSAIEQWTIRYDRVIGHPVIWNYPGAEKTVDDMSPIEHSPLAESEREALRRYADGLEDWAIGVLIGSAVWNVERLEAQLTGAVEALRAIAAYAAPPHPEPCGTDPCLLCLIHGTAQPHTGGQ